VPSVEWRVDYVATHPFTTLFIWRKIPRKCCFSRRIRALPTTQFPGRSHEFTCQNSIKSSVFHRRCVMVLILYYGPGQPFPTPKLSLSLGGGIWTRILHDYMGLPEPTCRTAPRSVQPFLQGSSMVTNTQTDHATMCVAMGHMCYACDAA